MSSYLPFHRKTTIQHQNRYCCKWSFWWFPLQGEAFRSYWKWDTHWLIHNKFNAKAATYFCWILRVQKTEKSLPMWVMCETRYKRSCKGKKHHLAIDLPCVYINSWKTDPSLSSLKSENIIWSNFRRGKKTWNIPQFGRSCVYPSATKRMWQCEANWSNLSKRHKTCADEIEEKNWINLKPEKNLTIRFLK